VADNRVLLFSGGQDSFAAWRLLGYPKAVYFDHNQRYMWREHEAIERLSLACRKKGLPPLNVEHVKTLNLGTLEACDAHIPHRNLLIAAAAAAQFDPEIVYIVALRGEASRDKSARFFRDTSRLLSFEEGHTVRVESPFRTWGKARVLREYIRRYPKDLDLMCLTFSCYSPLSHGGKGCGRCVACFRRWVAFELNGVETCDQFDTPPYEWGGTKPTLRDALKALRKADALEWPAILANNLEAWRALRQVCVRMLR
jgi:7-cyano-7-deazaguanine synthase in queuosine biosynthesis